MVFVDVHVSTENEHVFLPGFIYNGHKITIIYFEQTNLLQHILSNLQLTPTLEEVLQRILCKINMNLALHQFKM